ncbi:RluA family pseudouridine synthase [Desulfopila sp. IMCC35008]|uniref:RluA family pseudouridine synthase n=1 Tax=Desulfopila sp. IMCC35008 TaxID=2653858 RepID=UPI0013D0089C|nr:RluA family pseudouridine synthase [Desulfopila sp. IMCC35008]
MPSTNPDITIDQHPAVTFHVTIENSSAGLRLDHFLVHHFPECSRAKLIASIRSGTFTVNGISKKHSYKLKTGDLVVGQPEESPPLEVLGEEVEFDVLFEDSHLLVLSKPPGLVVHPGSGNPSGTLVNGLVHYCNEIAGVGDSIRPGIVHRLDKDTSGVMVVAKSELTHNRLIDAFKERALTKEYLTLVHGVIKQSEGRITAPIGRHPVHRQRMAVRELSGKYAASNWQLLEHLADTYSLLKVGIETGRTHQIRVHMNYTGHPVAGDVLYGKSRDNKLFPRQMLHASRLAFNHPVTGRKMRFTAPLWPDFAKVLTLLNSEYCVTETGFS